MMIRQGKGKKDRMVPIGERALDWIDKYVTDVRPILVCEPDSGTLFLTSLGDAFTPNRLTQLVRNTVNAADIGKTGACHLFRHTMATLMLEGGADVRFIQEMLGHVSLETTQIYMQVSIRKLKQIHAATHPSAKRGRFAGAAQDEPPEPEISRAKFLSSLAAEDEEDAGGGPDWLWRGAERRAMMKPVMPTYKAIVQGGRAVLENLEFEDGTELELEVVNDNDVDADEQLLNAELDASIEDIEAGRTYPAEEVFAELRARRR